MAQDRIVYIPWAAGSIGQFLTSGMDDFVYIAGFNNTVADKTHHKRDWTYVHLGQTGNPLAGVGLGIGTRVHVIGHGSVGDPTLYPPDGSGASPVGYQQVAEGLEALGLKKKYLGTIVCDACYSALGAPPFAKLLATALWKLGYKGTCVMGYKGSLQGGYVNKDQGGVTGKYVHRVVNTGTKTIKSSAFAARVRFFGFT